ncbi:MAG: hypothetical protein HFI05_01870 [Lachnospiraceae bacterium]|jgi:hypothetical protein|nr:hypothetical protein [Lachnospiraceae bacterium]
MKREVENFDEFKTIIMRRLREVLGEDIIGEEVARRNDTKFFGVMKATQGTLQRIVYLDTYYEKYKKYPCNIDDMILDIIKNLEAEPDKESLAIISELGDFSKVRNRLTFKLINYEMSKDYLSNIAYIKFLDLAIIYYVTTGIEDNSAELLVRQELLKIWGIKLEELHHIAKENMQKLFKIKIETIGSVISKLFQIPLKKLQEDTSEEVEMWVLNTERKAFGAVAILYDGALKDFAATVNSDIIILPSSIHEVLLVLDKELEYTKLKSIVKEVNSTVVAKDEILSNNIYIYNRELDKIIMLDSDI